MREHRDVYQDMRIEKVLALLDKRQDIRIAVVTEGEAIPDILILTIAIQGLAAFELHIPKRKFDVWKLTETIDRHSGTVTE